MKYLSFVYDLHTEIDQWLVQNPGNADDEELYEKPGINVCAYYVLLFAQFERIINSVYEELVGPNEESSFMHKVNVVSTNLSSPVTSDVLYYYDIRCDIAHGQNVTGIPFRLNKPFKFFREISAELTAS